MASGCGTITRPIGEWIEVCCQAMDALVSSFPRAASIFLSSSLLKSSLRASSLLRNGPLVPRSCQRWPIYLLITATWYLVSMSRLT